MMEVLALNNAHKHGSKVDERFTEMKKGRDGAH